MQIARRLGMILQVNLHTMVFVSGEERWRPATCEPCGAVHQTGMALPGSRSGPGPARFWCATKVMSLKPLAPGSWDVLHGIGGGAPNHPPPEIGRGHVWNP